MKATHAIQAGLIAVLLSLAASAGAQWLDLPTPGIPRLADGAPDLRAPAPRTPDGRPDFSGIWTIPSDSPRYLGDITQNSPEMRMHPWAEAIFMERRENEGRDRPSAGCLPHSVTDFDTHPTPKKVVQTPELIAILYEAYHSYRQIHLDGRSLPEDPEPAWFGYSVGRWEGDTLVVETTGIHERTWLDDAGHPHSEDLHIVERFQRPEFGRIELEITINDPKAYVEPWTVSLAWELMPDTELLDWTCLNNRYFELIPE